VIGLDAGCSTIHGVLPALWVVSGAQAVDVNLDARMFGYSDHIVFEISGVESYDARRQVRQ
jgi:hypothetical protein